MRKQQIQVDAAATLWFRVPDGRPSAAIVSITRASGAALSPVVTGESATIDSASSTISSWSSDSPKLVVVADSSAFRPNRIYRLTNGYGQTSDVDVIGVDHATDTLLLGDDPPWDLAAGHTVQSTWVSLDLLATQTAEPEANYQAQWTVTVGGEAFKHQEPFDVVRQIPYMVATPAGLYRYSPGLIKDWEVSATENGDWNPRLQEAFERILDDLDALGLRAHLLMDWLQVEKVTYEAVLLKLADESFVPSGGYDGQGEAWNKTRTQAYGRAFGKLRTNLESYDANNDGKPDEDRSWVQGSVSVR